MKHRTNPDSPTTRRWLIYPRLIARVAVVGIGLLAGGCGSKIQSDLQLENARFAVNESGKWQFFGSVKNTGSQSYGAIFIVVDAYEGNDLALRISTSADLFGTTRLEPRQSTGFSKTFEDGGYKPNRYEIVRLYATS